MHYLLKACLYLISIQELSSSMKKECTLQETIVIQGQYGQLAAEA